MPTVVPHKACLCGFALQSAHGVPSTVATVVFPLPEGTDFKGKWSKEVYQNNQGNFEETHYFTSGYTAEGSLKIPLVPGMLTAVADNIDTTPGGTDLFKWLFGRAADTTYYQGLYASLFFFYGQGVYTRYADVKCTGGSFVVENGSPVYMNANALGGGLPATMTSACFPAYDTAKWFDGTPYHGSGATISIGDSASYSGAAVRAFAADQFTKNHTLEWDNRVMSAGDASTLVPGVLGPYALPNVARAGWTGSFTRWFTDTYLISAATAGYEGKYGLSIVQGTGTFALTFPRILFLDGMYPSLPGDGIVTNDGISFKALGVLGNPGTRCFDLSETIAS
jgi:hypothetical protein